MDATHAQGSAAAGESKPPPPPCPLYAFRQLLEFRPAASTAAAASASSVVVAAVQSATEPTIAAPVSIPTAAAPAAAPAATPSTAPVAPPCGPPPAPSAAGPPRRALASLLSVDARRLRPHPTALWLEPTALRPKLTTVGAASTLTAAECAAPPQREAELAGAELPGAAV